MKLLSLSVMVPSSASSSAVQWWSFGANFGKLVQGIDQPFAVIRAIREQPIPEVMGLHKSLVSGCLVGK